MSDHKTVLLVDDDVDFLEANRIALEARGLKVLTASQSRTGAQMAQGQAPDLIVLDLMMERMDSGFSLLEELSSYKTTRDIPVLMVSAIVSSEDDNLFPSREDGRVDAFMSKPLDPSALLHRVAELMHAA